MNGDAENSNCKMLSFLLNELSMYLVLAKPLPCLNKIGHYHLFARFTMSSALTSQVAFYNMLVM